MNMPQNFVFQLRALRQQAVASGTKEQFEKAHEIFPLHKTFLTRKGCCVIFFVCIYLIGITYCSSAFRSQTVARFVCFFK